MSDEKLFEKEDPRNMSYNEGENTFLIFFIKIFQSRKVPVWKKLNMPGFTSNIAWQFC